MTEIHACRALALAGLLLAMLGAQPAGALAAQRAPQVTAACPAAPTDGGYCGDGGPVGAAKLADPSDVAAIPGGFLVADSANSAIRRVLGATISTAAGIGVPGVAPPAPGRAASIAGFAFSDPRGVTALQDGGFAVADAGLRAVLRVTPGGFVRTLRDSRNLLRPVDVVARDADTLLVADADAGRVFELDLDGTARPVAEGLVNPSQVALDPATGGIYVTEQRPAGGVVTYIAPDGVTRRPVAGPGAPGFAGQLSLDGAIGIAAEGRAVVVGDRTTVRAVFPDGSVLVLAGLQQLPDVTQPMNGVGLLEARGLVIDEAGRLLIADAGPDQIAVVPGVPQSVADHPDPLPDPIRPALGRRTNAALGSSGPALASGSGQPCKQGSLSRSFKVLALKRGRIFGSFPRIDRTTLWVVIAGREKKVYGPARPPASANRTGLALRGLKKNVSFFLRLRAPGGCRQTTSRFSV